MLVKGLDAERRVLNKDQQSEKDKLHPRLKHSAERQRVIRTRKSFSHWMGVTPPSPQTLTVSASGGC